MVEVTVMGVVTDFLFNFKGHLLQIMHLRRDMVSVSSCLSSVLLFKKTGTAIGFAEQFVSISFQENRYCHRLCGAVSSLYMHIKAEVIDIMNE